MKKSLRCPKCGSYHVVKMDETFVDDPLCHLPGTSGPIVNKPSVNSKSPRTNEEKKQFVCLDCHYAFDE